MPAPEREGFALFLEFDAELRAHVAGLQTVGTALVMSHLASPASPPAALKHRILGALDSRPRQTEPDSVVVTNPDERVQWVNPAFTAMCGYSLDELKGRKAGHLLQGRDTDPAAVQRIRESLRARRPCREALVNYHKNGTPYRVDVAITPILDDEGQPLWFVARERKMKTDQPSLSVGSAV